MADFPFTPQQTYTDLPSDLEIGDVWEGDIFNEYQGRGFIAAKTRVSQVTTGTVVPNNGDLVGLFIDGVLIQVTSTASANGTALLLETAIEGAAALASIITSVTVNVADITITFSDYATHTVVAYSPATADITPIANSATAVDNEKLEFGYAVVLDSSVSSVNGSAIARPSAIGQTIVGVLPRAMGNQATPEMLRLQSYDPDYLAPATAYTLALEKVGIVVEYTGTAPAPGDAVYVVMTGTGAGRQFRTTSGAVSQVTTGTVVANNGDTVGLTIDSLPNVTVTSTADATATAALLRDAINARADLAAIVTASSASAVVTLTFLDDQAHTVVAVSPATADVTPITNTTTAVAATAKLLPNSSWGARSNSSSTPTRAYLRVDVRGN